MDYQNLVKQVVALSGGEKNIQTVAHCATRLRFTLSNKNKADIDGIKKIDGVLGCIYATGQLQIILGKEVQPVYNMVSQMYHFKKCRRSGTCSYR